MKKIIVFSLAMSISHSIILFIVGQFIKTESASIQYGPISSLVYLFIFGYWAYVVASVAYLSLGKKYKSTLPKLILSIFLMLVGYLLSRTGDIIDGDFIHNFNLDILIFFIALSPSFILVERLLKKNFTRHYE